MRLNFLTAIASLSLISILSLSTALAQGPHGWPEGKASPKPGTTSTPSTDGWPEGKPTQKKVTPEGWPEGKSSPKPSIRLDGWPEGKTGPDAVRDLEALYRDGRAPKESELSGWYGGKCIPVRDSDLVLPQILIGAEDEGLFKLLAVASRYADAPSSQEQIRIESGLGSWLRETQPARTMEDGSLASLDLFQETRVKITPFGPIVKQIASRDVASYLAGDTISYCYFKSRKIR